MSATVTDDIILDVTPPTGNVTVAPTILALGLGTSSTLRLTATDDVSGVERMRVAGSAMMCGESWEPFAATKAWSFEQGNTVYVRFRDRAGNISEQYSVGSRGIAGARSAAAIRSPANRVVIPLALRSAAPIESCGRGRPR